MAITNQAVKELRALTGAGIVDCQKALEATNGNVEQAITWLRQKGKASAAKKATRTTNEGVVTSYIHSNHKLGVLVSLRCETDFVARTPAFQELARNIALHIAALDPMAVSPEEIPQELVEKERAIAQAQASASKKPAAIQEKIVEGKIKSFRQERALLTQAFVKDSAKTVAEVIAEAVSELGENIAVAAFSRLTV